MLKFSQYIWISGTLLAALILAPITDSFFALIIAAWLSVLPALATLWVIESDAERPMGEAAMVFGWTALATIAVVATGSVRSPAIILFAIGPLTAHIAGRARLTLEITVLSAVAYMCIVAFSVFGITTGTSETTTILGGTAAAMGMAQALILLVLAFLDQPVDPAASPFKSAASGKAQALPQNEDPDARLKQRTAYFASLSHDLRNPFTAILGYAEAFKMNLSGNLTDKQVDQASIIHESAEDLLALVDDMMDLAKSESGKLTIDPEPIHLGDLGKSIMHQMQAMADRKNVQMQFDVYGDPWAMVDARLVRRIWQNLISNAIKYSEPGDTIQLSASERTKHAILSVKDQGRGMSEEDLAQIAEPFTMGQNSGDKTGTGLGLVNVKRFTDMHGGKVVIDTAPGKGARFQVVLPKAEMETLEGF